MDTIMVPYRSFMEALLLRNTSLAVGIRQDLWVTRYLLCWWIARPLTPSLLLLRLTNHDKAAAAAAFPFG
jgi:hypothetical protein